MLTGRDIIAKTQVLIDKIGSGLGYLQDQYVHVAEMDKEAQHIIELRFQLIKETLFLLQGSFGELRDALEKLEYQKDPDINEAQTKVDELESTVNSVVVYLKSIGRY